MKKTFSITLGGVLFNIEDDAYARLKAYLDSIKKHYEDREAGEIVADIEAGIAEKFAGKIKGAKQVINFRDVEEMITILGTVDEFDAEENDIKKEGKGAEEEPVDEGGPADRKLYRDPDDIIIAGVCSGLGAYFGIDPVFVRLIFVALFFAQGIGLLLYVVLWMVMPVARSGAQKLEMKGEPVSIKRIEQSIKEKSSEIRRDLKKNGARGLKKVLYFPFEVLKQIVVFLKRIWRWAWLPVCFVCGLGIVIASVLAAAALTFAAGVIMFNIDSPLIVSDIPLAELARTASFYVVVIGAYFVALVPLLFLVLFGLTWFRRKNTFRPLISVVLLTVWIFSLVALGIGMIDLAPMVKQRIDDFHNTEKSTRIFEIGDLQKYRIGIDGTVNVRRGGQYSLAGYGDIEALNALQLDDKEGELTIISDYERDGICIFCFERPVELELTIPDLKSFIAFRRTRADLAGFDGDDVRVNAGESSRVKVAMSGGRLVSYVAGTGGGVELSGSPEILDITLEGFGRFTAPDLAAREVKVYQDSLTRANLAGRAGELTVELEGPAKLYAKDLLADNIKIKASSHAYSEVYPVVSLDAISQQHSRIYYKGSPKEIKRRTAEEGFIGELEDYDFRDIENGSSIRIDYEPEAYSPAMSSVRGITLRPVWEGNFGPDDLEFRWTTDWGNLVGDWNEYTGEVNAEAYGREVYWTFDPEGYAGLAARAQPIHIYVQAINERGWTEKGELVITWDENSGLFVVE